MQNSNEQEEKKDNPSQHQTQNNQSINTQNQQKNTLDEEQQLNLKLFKKRKNQSLKVREISTRKNILIIYKLKSDQKKSFKQIILQPYWVVKWIFDKKKDLILPFSQRVIGFKLIKYTENDLCSDVQYEKICKFYGDPQSIQQLRDYFKKHIFEYNFYDDFELKNKIGKGKYAKDALQQELEVLRKINHPNLLQFIRMYQDQEAYYIVTELLNHQKTLQDEISKFNQSVFSYDIIKKIMKQLLQGVEYLHSINIMHRDLKPQNIMFADQNQLTISNLKIIDFGLSQNTKEKTFIFTHVGTPGYVAPEILISKSQTHVYTEKCDIFSLGVIFHQLLTGITVFPGKKFNDILILNQKCQISFQGEKYFKISEESLNLLKLMLNHNPEERLSAQEALAHPFFNNNEDEYSKTMRKSSLHEIDYLLVNKHKNQQSGLSQFTQGPNTYAHNNQTGKLSHLYVQKAIQMLKQSEQSNNDQIQKQMLFRVLRQLVNVLLEFSLEQNCFFRNYYEDSSPYKFNMTFFNNSAINQQQQQEKLAEQIQKLEKQTEQTKQSEEKQTQQTQQQQIILKKEQNQKKTFDENRSQSSIDQVSLKIQDHQQNDFDKSSTDSSSPELQLKQEVEFPELVINPQSYIINQELDENFKKEQIKNLEKKLEQELQVNNKIKSLKQNQSQQKAPFKNLYLQVDKNFDLIQDEVIEYKSSQSQDKSEDELKNSKQSQQEISLTNDTNMDSEKKIPKDFILLLNYFPSDIILPFLIPNFTLLDINKQIKLLGQFLLFGKQYNKEFNLQQIQERLIIKKKKLFEPWYLNLMQSMIEQKIDLLEIQKIVNINTNDQL